MSTFNPGLAYHDYQQIKHAYRLAALVAFLMSSYFVVGYLAGSLEFWQWGLSQWLNGLVAIGLTGTMTCFQYFLYAKGDLSAGKWATALAIMVAAGFSLLSEVGQGVNRDHIRMETKSMASPVYQTMIQKLENQGATHPYTYQLEQAEIRLTRCQQKVEDGLLNHCDESQARLAAVERSITLHYQQALNLANYTKGLENDENNYHPLVNFFRHTFSLSGVVASFVLSLLIIGSFEYAFHFLGGRYSFSKNVLLNQGYDVTTKARTIPIQLEKMKVESALQLPVEQLPVKTKQTSDKTTVYTQAEKAKVGRIIACANCGKTFKKSNKWHLFCSNNRKPREDGGNCSDDWHNANNLERQKYQKGRV